MLLTLSERVDFTLKFQLLTLLLAYAKTILRDLCKRFAGFTQSPVIFAEQVLYKLVVSN